MVRLVLESFFLFGEFEISNTNELDEYLDAVPHLLPYVWDSIQSMKTGVINSSRSS